MAQRPISVKMKSKLPPLTLHNAAELLKVAERIVVLHIAASLDSSPQVLIDASKDLNRIICDLEGGKDCGVEDQR